MNLTRLFARPVADDARTEPPFRVPGRHAVLGTPLQPPFPAGMQTAVLALGCFWGAERLFWQLDGVHTTAAGYAGGATAHPTYREVCSGRTGHAEAVLVVFDPARIAFGRLLTSFWEAHDPTQGDRQGNDRGSQYRSAIFWTSDAQHDEAETSRAAYGRALARAGRGTITTQLAAAGAFFHAEEKHQQYLHKHPGGYCGPRGTGVEYALPSAGPEVAQEDRLLTIPASEDEWRVRLTRDEYRVLRKAGTERPFSGEYVKTGDDGTYRCRACGNALFDSAAKFDSRTGWPSFTEAITPEAVELRTDRKLGMKRTEVRCGRCLSHLGHVFDDGPRAAGGQRWCMNSIALNLDAS
jgi:peptide-methionine (S)-S-oxide reductase